MTHDVQLHGRGRSRSPSADAARPARTRWSARVVVDDEGVVVGRGAHEVAGGPHAEVDRARGRGRARARRDALLHARAVQPHRPHRALRAARRRRRHPPRRGRDRGSESARAAAAGSRILRDARHRRRPSACSKPRRARLNARVLHASSRSGRPFVTMKVALSADGCVAAQPGRRTPLTGAGGRPA